MNRTVISAEKMTDGEITYTAILKKGKWVKVSEHPDSSFKRDGYNKVKIYELVVPFGTTIAVFHKDLADGTEHVETEATDPGPSFDSFEEAHKWASEQ